MTTNSSPLRLLLIEDDPDSGQAMVTMLRRRGVEVTWVLDGEHGLKRFQDEGFDIMVVDIRLADTSGVDVLRRVRLKDAEFPVILVTAYDSLQSAIEAIRLGAQDYVLKPFDSIDDVLVPAQRAVEHYRRLLQNQRLHTDLMTSNRRLESTLAELSEAQLELVRRERLSALGEMARTVSHEFNNVLMPILGYIDMLLEHPDMLRNFETATEMLGTARAAASDAKKIASRLSSSSTEDPVKHSLLSINDIAANGVAFAMSGKDLPDSGYSSIQVKQDLGKVRPIMGDATELREVLVNLIVNACEAMPEGGTITIRSCMDDYAVCLSVEDTGCGMAERVRSRCTEPLFSTKSRAGVRGLGLSIVRGMVDRHNGSFTIRSSPGEGTRVTLRFPVENQSGHEWHGTLSPQSGS